MLPLTLSQIAEVTGGTVHDASPDQTVTGNVVFDSRAVQPGDLFAAFVGAHDDGHRFVPDAMAAGAVGVLASRPVFAPAVVVPDVGDALTTLAGWSARRMNGTVKIGITGSSGKTSTKDLVAQVLDRQGPTTATIGSRNNELGVPVTVLSATEDTRYLVLEMGARGIGHLAHLTSIVALDAAVVLNVGTAHAGEFGSKEATAQAKGELVEALTPAGTAVLNADDPLVAQMASRTEATIVWFGRSPAAHVRAENVKLDSDGRASFLLVTPSGSAPVSLQLFGEHHVHNALAAAALAYAQGMPADAVASALSMAHATSAGRMQRHDLPDGSTIIDDSYNANPDSMRAGLQALAAMRGSRRTIAVLGEMAELGITASQEHHAVGALAGQLGVDVVVAVGQDAAARTADGAEAAGVVVHRVADAQAASDLLIDLLRAGDVVLVKGSRSAGLQAVVHHVVQVAASA
ncbi:UDP-N-acetylmuramoyl-tripeptide--D-alanyl-D-alanine ligase [Actinoplanes sp. NPDC000266]